MSTKTIITQERSELVELEEGAPATETDVEKLNRQLHAAHDQIDELEVELKHLERENAEEVADHNATTAKVAEAEDRLILLFEILGEELGLTPAEFGEVYGQPALGESIQDAMDRQIIRHKFEQERAKRAAEKLDAEAARAEQARNAEKA